MKKIGELIDTIDCSRDAEKEFPYHFAMEKADVALRNLLGKCINSPQWLEGYDEIVAWLTDNNRKGLLLIGGCGVGKTIIAQAIIPHIIHYYRNKVFAKCKAHELNTSPIYNEILRSRFKVIDDIGTEPDMNDFGVRKVPLRYVVDSAEERGDMLILTTNLRAEQLKARYGERTYDRLRSNCKVVIIKGKSQR